MKVSAMEPMVVVEDLELESALESAYISQQSAIVRELATAPESETVSDEDTAAPEKHNVERLARALANLVKKQSSSPQDRLNAGSSSASKYTELKNWEEDQALLGNSIDRAA